MPIICVEGPSAVGKTTVCRQLVRRAGARHVPEVHELLTRPEGAGAGWYLRAQQQRWQAARTARRHDPSALILLDGDPFQPLWYGWTYGFPQHALDELAAHYRREVASGRLRFPDLYVLLLADETELRQRMAADTSRRRRNFERHLRLLQTLPLYFRYLGQLLPERVMLVITAGRQLAYRQVHGCVQLAPAPPVDRHTASAALERLFNWLQEHPQTREEPSAEEVLYE